MTVQELIELLNKVEDKTQEVKYLTSDGFELPFEGRVQKCSDEDVVPFVGVY